MGAWLSVNARQPVSICYQLGQAIIMAAPGDDAPGHWMLSPWPPAAATGDWRTLVLQICPSNASSASVTYTISEFCRQVRAEMRPLLDAVSHHQLRVYRSRDAFESGETPLPAYALMRDILDENFSNCDAARERCGSPGAPLLVLIAVEGAASAPLSALISSTLAFLDLEKNVVVLLDSTTCNIDLQHNLRLVRRTADTRCLTLDLNERLTTYQPDDADNVKVMLTDCAGVGKTRTLLELLWRQHGLYFVASGSHDHLELGSRDLHECMQWCVNEPLMAMRYIETLVVMRKAALKWFMRRSPSPGDWLLAQLYPALVFGHDIFSAVFEHLMVTDHDFCEVSLAGDLGSPLLIAVDEIQHIATAGIQRWSDSVQTQPFIVPLMQHIKTCAPRLIIAGTGMNRDILQGFAPRRPHTTLKHWRLSIQDIHRFPDWDQSKVRAYSEKVIAKRMGIMGRRFPDGAIAQIAQRIAQNPVCCERPRFTALVLDRFFDEIEKGIDRALEDAFRSLRQ